ncbi:MULTISPECIES: hypothetical protein [Paracoccus]|uniref:Uncharacterized protein n=1 Tax=Paracoccus tibetensis TaxID=336292 RepID=A0A1G5JNP3_9RHOB|nr:MULTISPECIES: hypothetical protein [Paracoccus]KIX16130.1 hypothetical protein SY26_19695 [Paracoccus sp. 228]SCY89947.1 hypothetical protein SAMN05660710_03333 [Paracoccus tibetensis]
MAIFEIVTMTDDHGMSRVHTDDLTAWAEDMGTEITGTETRTRLRPELQGQPILSGFVGPCWGGRSDAGEPIIRYEDSGTYAALSQ